MIGKRSFAVCLTALAAVLVVVIPLSARGQLPERKGSGDASAGWQEKNPFGRLFIAPDAQKSEPSDPRIVERPGVAVAAPTVVCGMTVVQADPAVDPNILVKPDLVKPEVVSPGRRNLKPVRFKTDYKIRSIAPPICH